MPAAEASRSSVRVDSSVRASWHNMPAAYQYMRVGVSGGNKRTGRPEKNRRKRRDNELMMETLDGQATVIAISSLRLVACSLTSEHLSCLSLSLDAETHGNSVQSCHTMHSSTQCTLSMPVDVSVSFFRQTRERESGLKSCCFPCSFQRQRKNQEPQAGDERKQERGSIIIYNTQTLAFEWRKKCTPHTSKQETIRFLFFWGRYFGRNRRTRNSRQTTERHAVS